MTAPKRLERPVSDHAHHWRCEDANGPKSQAVCKFCGEVREFSNSGPDTMTYHDFSRGWPK